jgi:hypothetical protein
MECQRCESEQIARFRAKCSDLCFVGFMDKEYWGYVPSGIGIGGGDYIELNICIKCGQVQGKFPITQKKFTNHSGWKKRA